MKRKIIFSVSLVALLWANALFAQYIIKDVEDLNNLGLVAQEKAYLSHSGSTVFAGEYMYYALYVFNTQSNRLSDLSSVGYVALVDPDKKVLFEQKVKLEKGLGQGDFFISTDIPSGKYKLLAYTNWMKNNGLKQVFQEDLTIINPYRVDVESNEGQDVMQTAQVSQVRKQSLLADTATITLQLPKKQFDKREQVTFDLKNYKGYLGNGFYTLKVVKSDTVFTDFETTSVSYASAFLNADKKINKSVGDSLFLPEQRGELFYGRVFEENSTIPAEGKTMVVSIPGEEFILKFANTDAQGNFYTYVRKDYQIDQLVVQPENDAIAYEVVFGEMPSLDLSSLKFSTLKLKSSAKDAIVKRSVENQIENQFFSIKPDSVLLGDPNDPFDGGIPETVVLDDYTRFATFEETLVEILGKVGYRNNGKGADYIRILQDFETVAEDYNDYPAIVLIDGVYIPNHEEIKDFDARKIESISYIQDQFVLGNKNYQGIMSVKTFDGNFYEEYAPKVGLNEEIQGLLPIKNYYRQLYPQEGASPFERIPDYRRLLFWQPTVALETSGKSFSFYTSDIEGTYKIILDGFTTYGKPIHMEETFEVGSSLH